MDGLGFVTGDGPAIEAAVRRGEHVLVQPGGTREGYRSFRHDYEVDWGDRTGYLRLAIRHRLPIVPSRRPGSTRSSSASWMGIRSASAPASRTDCPSGSGSG